MADLAVWQRTIVDEKGNVIPGAEVEVRSYPDGSLITLYEGPDGTQVKGNPFSTGADGFARFWAESQRAEIIAHGAGSTIRWVVDLLNADEVIGNAISEATAAAADAVNEAKAEADRAEAARDAAQLNAHIYPSTAAGLAATTDGDYFSVPSEDDDEYLILYRNDDGSATEVRRYPSAEAVRPFVSPAIANNDWDAITRSGFYSNTTNSAVGLPASRTWLTLLHVEKADNFAHQLAIRQHPDTPQMWMRTRGGPQPTDPVTWGEWHEIAYKSDVIPPLTTDSLNWNEVHRTGYYINSSSSAVGLPTDVPGMAMMHIERDDGGAEQIAMRQNSAAPQVWRRFRGYGTGEWTEWTEFLTEHHLASLVSADTYVRKSDVSGLPYELFTSEDEAAFDFTNPEMLEYEKTGGEVDHVLAVWGDRRVRRYTPESRAMFGTLYGRYALQGSEDDTRMLFQTRDGSVARAIPPESQEATIVISHVTLDDVRKVIFWQSTPDAPGRLQLHCNASYDGSGVSSVPGAVNLFIGGASGGRGINGQPLAGSHPPGVPSVFSIVLRPPGQLSEFRQNGRVIDTFEAPGVFADASSDIFGRSGVFPSADRTGAAYSRIAVLHRAVNERELNLLEEWAGAGFGIRSFGPHNQPVEVADLTCDFAAVCKLPNVPPSAMRGKPFPLLFERNPDGLAMPASLTKVMTAIVMLDNIQSLHEKVEVTEADITSGTGQNISPGDIITYRDALYNLMLPSSNRAALLIGRTVGEKMLAVENETGDPLDRFVAEMNRYAEMFDMTNTNYVNPHGVTDEQFTTARDMLKLGIQATAYKDLMWVWGTPTYSMQVEGPNPRIVNLTNTTTAIVDPDTTTESFGRRIAYGAKTGNLAGSVDPEWRGRTMLAMVEAPDGGVLLGCVLRASSTPELRTRDVKRIFDAASAVVLRE